MAEHKTMIRNIILSLSDLVGIEYAEAVCKAKAYIENRDIKEFLEIANEKVEFFPSTASFSFVHGGIGLWD